MTRTHQASYPPLEMGTYTDIEEDPQNLQRNMDTETEDDQDPGAEVERDRDQVGETNDPDPEDEDDQEAIPDIAAVGHDLDLITDTVADVRAPALMAEDTAAVREAGQSPQKSPNFFGARPKTKKTSIK